MKTYKYIVIFISSLLLLSACSDDFLDAKDNSHITAKDAMVTADINPQRIESFITGVYSLMVNVGLVSYDHDSFGFMSILHSTDMMSEDIVMSKFSFFGYDYQHDNHDETYRRTYTNWVYLYTIISNANTVLEITNPETVSDTIKIYRAQAYALRGMAYYYLIQLYQHTYNYSISKYLPGVPINYADNEGKEDIYSRASVETVYAQIESDLTTAVANLNGWTRSTKNQIDYYVANGLLARYYLLSEQWQKAVDAAVIAQSGFPIMSKADLHDGFMNIQNDEWMWGFDHSAETSTVYASFFSHISNITPGYAGMGYAPRLIDRRLYDLIPSTDERKKLFQGADTLTIPADDLSSSSMEATKATTWQYPYANVKFGYDGNWTMDYPYMRAAEMVLIEAEGLARLEKNTEAATALKKLMDNRDAAWSSTSVSKEDVYLQRRIELWGEGFAFFDLKRMNKGIDRTYTGTNHPVYGQKKVYPKAVTWIYQIPISEIQENTEIDEKDQNE